MLTFIFRLSEIKRGCCHRYCHLWCCWEYYLQTPLIQFFFFFFEHWLFAPDLTFLIFLYTFSYRIALYIFDIFIFTWLVSSRGCWFWVYCLLPVFLFKGEFLHSTQTSPELLGFKKYFGKWLHSLVYSSCVLFTHPALVSLQFGLSCPD